MEEEKVVSTRGRKPKVENTENISTDNDIVKKLMEQVQELAKQVEDSKSEKTNLENLVSALKSNKSENADKKNLPKKVKVMSLVPNLYNLTTGESGHGKPFTFNGIGSVMTIKTSDLEDILSIPSYRKQAEEGYFYILDKEIVEDQDLTEFYEKICNEDQINHIVSLKDESSVVMFKGLNKEVQESIAVKIAEEMVKGKKFDRNRTAEIKEECGFDIDQMAVELKKNGNIK